MIVRRFWLLGTIILLLHNAKIGIKIQTAKS